MGESTTYDVGVRYSLDGTDRSSRGLRDMGDQADRTAKSVFDVRDALKIVGTLAAGGYGLREGKKYLVDFNNDIEQLKISMSQTLALNLHLPFEKAEEAAAGLFTQFEKTAALSPGTTKDFVEMGNALAGPVLRAGGTLKDLHDVTRGIALSRGNIGAEQAQLDFEQLLAGTVGKKDRYARSLIEPHGLTTELWNALPAAERLKKALAFTNDPTILAAAKKQAESFAGVTSTFEDAVERTFGKVGLPLFQEITAEVQKWNDWVDKNPEKLQQFAQKFGGALVDGFHAVRDSVTFIVEHRDALLAIAGAWAATRAVGGRGGLVGGVGALAAAAPDGSNPRAELVNLAFGARGSRNAALMEGVAGGALALGSAFGAATAGLATYTAASNITHDKVASGFFALAAAASQVPLPFSQLVAGSSALIGGFALLGDHLHKLNEDFSRRERAANNAVTSVDKSIFRGGNTENYMHELDRLEERRRHAVELGGKTGGFVFEAAGARQEAIAKDIDAASSRVYDLAQQYGALDEAGHLVGQKFADELVKNTSWPRQLANAFTTEAFNLLEARARVSGLLDSIKARDEKQTPVAPRDKGTHVTIQRIEVAATDPDRFIHAIVGEVNKRVKNPIAARRALRGG